MIDYRAKGSDDFKFAAEPLYGHSAAGCSAIMTIHMEKTMPTTDDLVKRLDNLWAMLEGEGYYTKANTVVLAKGRIEELEAQVNWYRDRVVWGFYEEETPEFYQGKSGEHEICEPVNAEQVTRYFKTLDTYERKLEKALTALGEVQRFVKDLEPYADQGHTLVPALQKACAVYAELKGETND